MPFIPSFYAGQATAKPPTDRIYYHNNSACSSGQAIGASSRLPSTGGHSLCAACEKLNSQEATKRW